MFPPEFVRDNIEAYSRKGDLVLDPFSGRGTTLLESLITGRKAIAGDINPVAYCVSAAKADIPSLKEIEDELHRLERVQAKTDVGVPVEIATSHFFRRAFHPDTLGQLLFLRRTLQWRENRIHRFLTALTLGHLHGESDRSDHYFSNQMPHSISTKPNYSVRYWSSHRLQAPSRDVFAILRSRAAFRLETGVPKLSGRAALCDVRQIARAFRGSAESVGIAVTSPPYLDVTNFEEDQWLRLWFLGGPPHPTYRRISRDDRLRHESTYWDFLQASWRGIAPLMRPKAVLICRIGAKGKEPDTLMKRFSQSISSIWPRAHALFRPRVSELKRSQITVLNPKAEGCRYEIDFGFSLA